jgi:hypothetical protein
VKLSPTLIGLGGRLRSGKDAAADHLVAEHGFVKLGMSDALHEAMLAIDPVINIWDDGTFERYAEAVAEHGYVAVKRDYPEARRLLQNLGTEVGRNMIGENVWSNITARKIDDHRGAGHRVVVTGLRFPNEIQMVRELGGQTIWVERPGLESGSSSTHASETSVGPDDFGAVLLNDQDLPGLHHRVSDLLAH